MNFYYLKYILGALHVSFISCSSHLRRSREGTSDLYARDEERNMKQKHEQLKFFKSQRNMQADGVVVVGDGLSNHGWFGVSVSLSGTGDTMVAGGYANVILYTQVNDGWELEYDVSHLIFTLGGWYNVGISNDGTHVVIGAPNNDQLGDSSGQVYVIKKEAGSWNPVGRELYGEKGDSFGCAVSISEDGGIMAAGAFGGLTGPGYVLLYKYSASTKKYQVIRRVVGGTIYDYYGYSISLSGNGEVLAAGAIFNDESTGFARVTDVSGRHTFATTFVGNTSGDYFGTYVSLSFDGLVLAVGATGGSYVRTFEYDENIFGWKQLGIDVLGGFGEDFGTVGLSEDGKRLVVGSTFNSRYGSSAGRMNIFEMEKGEWLVTDKVEYGSKPNDLCGTSVAISSNGAVAAFGCPGKDDGGYDTGQVKAFTIPADISTVGSVVDYDDGIDFEDDQINSNDDENKEYIWGKIGGPIESYSNHQEIGKSLSISSDGETMIFGGRIKAFVYTYQSESGSWVQETDFSNFGSDAGNGCFTVALSGDGTHVAIGAANNDKLGNDAGEVRNYKKGSSSAWEELGKPLNGKEGNLFGLQVSLSEDGQMLAVGAYGGSYVIIYEFRPNTAVYSEYKTYKGQADQGFGFSVAMSRNGDTCIVGAPFADNDKGFIRLYDAAKDSFSQTISGIFEDDKFGFSVTVSTNGLKAAAGAPGGNYVQAFEYQSIKWEQMGINIDGYSDAFGSSVTMAGSGDLLAIGAPLNALYGAQAGRTYVLRMDETGNWERVGSNINGEAGDNCGGQVSFSKDGQKLAVGYPLKSKYAYFGGQVRVFNVTEDLQ